MAEEYDREVLMRRGDIKRIINMDNRIFERWYDERSCATKVLLEYYRTIGSIPSLLAHRPAPARLAAGGPRLAHRHLALRPGRARPGRGRFRLRDRRPHRHELLPARPGGADPARRNRPPPGGGATGHPLRRGIRPGASRAFRGAAGGYPHLRHAPAASPAAPPSGLRRRWAPSTDGGAQAVRVTGSAAAGRMGGDACPESSRPDHAGPPRAPLPPLGSGRLRKPPRRGLAHGADPARLPQDPAHPAGRGGPGAVGRPAHRLPPGESARGADRAGASPRGRARQADVAVRGQRPAGGAQDGGRRSAPHTGGSRRVGSHARGPGGGHHPPAPIRADDPPAPHRCEGRQPRPASAQRVDATRRAGTAAIRGSPAARGGARRQARLDVAGARLRAGVGGTLLRDHQPGWRGGRHGTQPQALHAALPRGDGDLVARLPATVAGRSRATPAGGHRAHGPVDRLRVRLRGSVHLLPGVQTRGGGEPEPLARCDRGRAGHPGVVSPT